MSAIIITGGKQYRVEQGSEIAVEKLPGKVGEKVQLSSVLMVGDKIGAPLVEGAHVDAEITKQGRLRKISLFKKKRRTHYRRHGGHRQFMTWLKIAKING